MLGFFHPQGARTSAQDTKRQSDASARPKDSGTVF